MIKSSKGKITARTILCIDGKCSFEAFTKENNLEHQTINVFIKHHKKEKYQLQKCQSNNTRYKELDEDFNFFV